MEVKKHYLLSRKWWALLIGAVAVPLNQMFGIELPVEALVVVAISIASYIFGESKVDMEAMKTKNV